MGKVQIPTSPVNLLFPLIRFRKLALQSVSLIVKALSLSIPESRRDGICVENRDLHSLEPRRGDICFFHMHGICPCTVYKQI